MKRRMLPTSLAMVVLVSLWSTLLSAGMVPADTRDLRVEGKKPAEYVAAQSGKSWAVVIGINDYRDPKIRRLKYAVADAEAVGQELARRGYDVTMLLNQQATRRNIESELRTKLRKHAGKDDRVVVYYAGHGQDDKVDGSRTMGYILPVDGELEDIPATGISMGVVKELADALPVRQALFLVDACYGGVAGQQTRSLPKMNEAYLRQITRERGRQLITAGGADQEALEASDGGHGLFTTYLLKGLSEGLADLNGDGIIPASELYAYLDSRVFSDAQMRGHQQRPEIWSLSPEKGEFVFFATEREPLQLAKAYDLPKQIQRELTGKDGASMVLVPGGQFWMGSRENEIDRAIEDCITQLKGNEPACKGWFTPEQPRHQVRLDAFYLDTYEVTNRLFDKFVKATGYQTTAEKEGTAFAWIESKGFQDTSGASWRQPEAGALVFASNRGQHPVVSVSWHDAEAYCRWAGKRLPTEAEFEYATRAGTQTSYWWGNGSPGTRRVANVADESAKNSFESIMTGYDDGYVKTAPVGSYDSNPFGLFDMTGNVAEWTADWYGGKYYATSPERNPTGPANGQIKVIRGGSWVIGPVRLRSAYRDWGTATGRDPYIGFRCAQDRPN